MGGPRPERPEIAKEYEKFLPEFALRLQVKAGLTGYVSRMHPVSLKWLIVDVLVGSVVFSAMYVLYGWKSKNNLASKLMSLVKTKIKS